ncbi:MULTISPECIES: hypothetical protein [Shewanella]|uniref:Uncharacterized protein n=1 Tax=Shewanella metallivivens TaxID=2872342 RepID=A0ABT5TIP4_9GAMM|nr:hypothetical protein [Shewanella metallivivens]MDD8058465.1 hypothetical protein [Shewanella metallivivens]
MTKLIGIISIISLWLSASVFAADAQHCVLLDDSWGNSCGSPDSLQIKVKNGCSQTIYVKMCIEKKDGKWSCGSDSSLAPGRTNTGFYTCHATSRYKWSACTGGYKECGFKNL